MQDGEGWGSMDETVSARSWAREEFEHLRAGDPRHRRRVLDMASSALLKPAGTITEVFPDAAKRKGAYTFLSSSVVSAEALLLACGTSCALRASALDQTLIPLDGSCVSLPDPHGHKRFGRLGSRKKGRGLKVISAIGVAPDGTPLGLLAQTWWARTGKKRKKKHASTPVAKKETQKWLDTIEQAHHRLLEHAPDTQGVFIIDREGDNWAVLGAIAGHERDFIIRAARDRTVLEDEDDDGKSAKKNRSNTRSKGKGKRTCKPKRKLRETVNQQPVLMTFVLDVPAGPKRRARRVTLEVRVCRVLLPLYEASSGKPHPQHVNVVSVREVGKPPKGEKALDWLLMTSLPIDTEEEVCAIINGYQTRWSIESFHKTWKSGGCQIEDTQLRDRDRVIKWAVILAAVAIRVERMKHLGRTQPELPASEELSIYEINALLLLKQREKKRTEEVPNEVPTMQKATLWLAHLGGYVDQKSPPGAITIGRGFERVRAVAEAFEELNLTPRLAPKAPKKPGRAARTG
jgi:hypothetical protein